MRAGASVCCVLLVTSVSSAVNASAAETAAADESVGLEEIVVTAQKREETLSSVPMSITALSGDQLRDRGVTDVKDLAKVTPGLSYVESGSSTPVFSLRGVGFFDTSLGARPTVTVYDDEIPLPFSIMAQGASLDLARVEVLKGPQGTLFGQNSTGGAINYVAAKPTATFEGGGTLSYGRFNTVDTTGYLSGPLAPELDGRLALRVLRSDDWQYSITRNDTLGAKQFYQGRQLLDWKPLDNLSFELNLNGFRDRSDTQAAQLVGRIYSVPALASAVPVIESFPIAPANDRAADWDPGRDLDRDNSFYQVALRGNYVIDSDKLALTSLTAYSNMDVRQAVDQDGTPVTASLTDIVGNLSSLSQEIRASGELGPTTYVLGGNYSNDYTHESDDFQFPYTTSGSPGGSGVPGLVADDSLLTGRQRYITKAVFGNFDWKVTPEWIGHAGLRYTDVTLDAEGCSRAGNATSATTYSILVSALRAQAGLAPINIPVGDCVSVDTTLTPGERIDHLDERNVSWRTGLDWKPASDVLLYANVSRGYKSGSAPTIPAIEQSELAPVTQESVLAYELGFKAPLVDRLLDATGALFYDRYTDKQLQGREPTILGVLPALVNVPKSRIEGAEFQLNALPLHGLALSLGGTYLDTKVLGDFNNYTILGLPANFRGEAFPYTPKYQLVGDVSYQTPVTDNLYAIAGADLDFRSKTNAGFGDDPRLSIDAYTLTDLRLGVRNAGQKWEATLYVHNLTDRYYWTNVARLSDVIRRYTGEPRTFGIQLSGSF